MFKLDSEAALLKAFRPKDRASVEISAEVKLPALVRHALAWTHPAGGRVYLVFSAPKGVPTGIVFVSTARSLMRAASSRTRSLAAKITPPGDGPNVKSFGVVE